MELPSTYFKPKLEKIKKKDQLSKKFILTELSSSNIRKFLIFSQKKAFLIFQEIKTPKKFFIFQETELSYILGNGNPKKLLIFQKVNFQTRKMKKKHFLYFKKWNSF